MRKLGPFLLFLVLCWTGAAALGSFYLVMQEILHADRQVAATTQRIREATGVAEQATDQIRKLRETIGELNVALRACEAKLQASASSPH